MATTFTIRGFGTGFSTPETCFTGSEQEARSIADEFARSCADELYAVVVTGPDPDDVRYVAHPELAGAAP